MPTREVYSTSSPDANDGEMFTETGPTCQVSTTGIQEPGAASGLDQQQRVYVNPIGDTM